MRNGREICRNADLVPNGSLFQAIMRIVEKLRFIDVISHHKDEGFFFFAPNNP